MLYFLLKLIYHLFTAYIVGVWCFLCQIFTRHKYLEGIALQTGKVAIVTGGASGIGYYVSKGLVAKNVHVIIAGKSRICGLNAIDKIRKDFPNAKVDFMELDLTSLQSVRDFVDQFISTDLRLHILVNNAGVMFPPYKLTQDGFELQLQVNYLAHLHLTRLLSTTLAMSARADNCWARVVNVSSSMHVLGSPDLDRLGQKINHWSEYSPHKGYSDSKLMVVAASYGLDTEFRRTDMPVTVCALHPGVVSSNLWRHLHWVNRGLQHLLGPLLMWTPEQGADTILYAAMSAEVEGQGGCYYDNSQSCRSADLTYDVEFQQKLLDQSSRLIDTAKARTNNLINK